MATRLNRSFPDDAEAPRTVLIADDDTLLSRALARDLRARGYEVRTAASFDQAVALAEAHPPELAILDLRFGDHSGLEVLRAVQKVSPRVSAVLMSGFGSIATAVEAMRLGAVNFLTKPVHVDEILASLLAAEIWEPAVAAPEDWTAPSVARTEFEHIRRVLAECDGNISEAARRMGMHRRSLQRKLGKLPPLR